MKNSRPRWISIVINVFIAAVAGWIVFGLGGGLLAAWREHRADIAANGDPNESPRERLKHLRESAERIILPEATNHIVGLTRIIKVDSDLHDENFTKWRATVTAEHVNLQGGIERTNLLLKFGRLSGGNQAYCYPTRDGS